MTPLHAVYYRASDGSQPVDDAIGLLPERHQAIVDAQIGRLNLLSTQQPHLPFPHSSQVRAELRELRCHFGSSHYRILYRRSGHLLVLLHFFAKRSRAIPEAEIAVAQARFADFRARMDADPRRPPRAAGQDAP